ncbi:MAG: hypothetical protein GXO66_00725 [Euryarchaeota archaeon]|nr:hypothetical protein [Euryarchaeota archaeon]
MKVVSNSVALIYLFKIREVALLKRVFECIKIPPTVYREVVEKGMEKGYTDAWRIREEVSELIEVVPLDEEAEDMASKLERSGLERGEAETIALARHLNLPALLDEKKARSAAEANGVAYFGTLSILLLSVKEVVLSAKEARAMVKKLVSAGFWLSPEVLSEFYSRLEDLTP